MAPRGDHTGVEYEPSPKEIDPPRRFAAVDKARELLGWEAQVGVREGVEQTAEWLRDTEVAA